MRKVAWIFAVTAILVSGKTLAADFSLGGRIGLPGIGIEAATKFSDSFGMRANLGGLAYSFDFTYDDVDYDVEWRNTVGSVLFDLYPMSGKFRLTAGAAYYNSKADIRATPSPGPTYQIGNTYYSAAAIGTLNGTVEYRKFAPYVGFGFDFMARKQSGFGVTFDAGLYFIGKPNDVSLTATGGGVSSTDLALETGNIEDDTQVYDIAIGVGIYYRF